MRDMVYQQGETIRLTVTVEESGAESAEFVVFNATTNVIVSTALFSGLTADVSTTDTVIPPGAYSYYVRIIWDDDSVDIIPDTANCGDQCDFPSLTICEIPGVS